MVGWNIGRVVGVVKWREGRVEGWYGGGMVRWWDGRVVGW